MRALGSEEMADPLSIQFAPDASAFDAADALTCDRVAAVRERLQRPVLIGFSGPQGSGKTTTCERLRERLQARGLKTVILALDDFYLTRRERAHLAQTVHPLLATRGVPGTHDVALMQRTIAALSEAGDSQQTALPAFDKAQDDRTAPQTWPTLTGRPDIMILEGWCIGASPQTDEALRTPINSLEADEDPQGVWRAYVNDRLAGDYRDLFASFDDSVALLAESFDRVFAWRAQQEAALRLRFPDGPQVMSDAQVARFIAHYERITRALIAHPTAALRIELAADRRPLRAAW